MMTEVAGVLLRQFIRRGNIEDMMCSCWYRKIAPPKLFLYCVDCLHCNMTMLESTRRRRYLNALFSLNAIDRECCNEKL